ncbi:hypothetical protein [Rubripirellula reticaptiva]|uniref:Uncharacterized protein n=1 Tax=Rubripirellula reticaptiva TaxID=2528013 RepID=A0A5C6EKN5_9BACT|nr:hypothetical protein [Rubripirellula reticaptiva]TWU49692.1 hypothetical protein Poly59_43140 [Rubripirellula reticaptiva]
MAKNDNLKQKLKAADRRRSRRTASQADSSGAAIAFCDDDSASTNSVDVTGLCVAEILKMNGKQSFRDSEVITAMRSCLNAGTPSSSEAQLLSQRLNAIGKRDDVSEKRFRDALQSLVKSGLDHRNEDNDSAFVQFLAVLAS